MRDERHARGLSDGEARAIAEGLARGADSPGGSGHELTAQRHQLADADEDRVEAALVDIGAASQENTTMAEREGGAAE